MYWWFHRSGMQNVLISYVWGPLCNWAKVQKIMSMTHFCTRGFLKYWFWKGDVQSCWGGAWKTIDAKLSSFGCLDSCSFVPLLASNSSLEQQPRDFESCAFVRVKLRGSKMLLLLVLALPSRRNRPLGIWLREQTNPLDKPIGIATTNWILPSVT